MKSKRTKLMNEKKSTKREGLEADPKTVEYLLFGERRRERERIAKQERERVEREKKNAIEAKRRTKKALKEKIVEPAGPYIGCSLNPRRGPQTGIPTTKPRLSDIEERQH